MGSCCSCPKPKKAADPMQVKREKVENMSIFNTQSVLIKKHGPEKAQTMESKFVHQFSDASTALRKNYTATNVNLGEGTFGQVFLFKSKTDPPLDYAVKILLKGDLSTDVLDLAREEVSILSMLDHPSIVKYVESYEDDRYMYIVMEFIEQATELQEIIEKQKKILEEDPAKAREPVFPESEVRRIMLMILGGIYHIHSNGIVHRDLKPENLLVDKNLQLRIIDFGLAKHVKQREYGNMLIGTKYYMGPEIFEMQGANEAYKQPLDCWSAGVIMYYLICGELPFQRPDLEDKIRYEGVFFSHYRWSTVSYDAKDLIQKLLNKDPFKRMTAKESLNHRYFKDMKEQLSKARAQKLNPAIFRSLTGYKGTS